MSSITKNIFSTALHVLYPPVIRGPKNQFFSKEKARSFEVGVDAAVEGLRRQLKKHKEKALAH